jgi:hypothetical protein
MEEEVEWLGQSKSGWREERNHHIKISKRRCSLSVSSQKTTLTSLF